MPSGVGSPRGLFRRNKIALSSGASNGILFDGYSASTPLLTANSTALLLAGALAVSGVTTKTITANSTGIKIGSRYVSTNTTGNVTT